MRKLKVFEAQIGFYDTVVAAPSRTAALRAWGIRQNLFASGQARVSNDVDATAVAIDHPEMPLRRALGSKAPYSLEPAGLPAIPAIANKQRHQRTTTLMKPKPPVDRSPVDFAEKYLRDLDRARSQEEEKLQVEADELERRRRSAHERHAQLRKQASDRLDAARRAYRKAGGTS